MLKTGVWQHSNLQAFWADIAPSNHILQVYEDPKVLLNALEGFAGSGLIAGHSVIIIASRIHIDELEFRLEKHGFDLDHLTSTDQFIPVDAEEMLSKFMVNGKPDKELFIKNVSELMALANKNGRPVRAFGEMVALLWNQGNKQATFELEFMWEEFCKSHELCLFCAYPKSGFSSDTNDNSIMHICKSHSKVIAGWAAPSTEIIYKDSCSETSLVSV